MKFTKGKVASFEVKKHRLSIFDPEGKRCYAPFDIDFALIDGEEFDEMLAEGTSNLELARAIVRSLDSPDIEIEFEDGREMTAADDRTRYWLSKIEVPRQLVEYYSDNVLPKQKRRRKN